jgi:hypothetical protein
MALRGFVDDVITFVEVVDDSLPIPEINSEQIDVNAGLTSEIVRRIQLRGGQD